MNEDRKKRFDWQELVELFCIREGELEDKEKEDLLKWINSFAEKHGRDYVVRNVALRQQ